MNNIKKILIGALAAVMLLLTIAGSVNAYSVIYPDLYPISPNYHYYGAYDGIPTVAGPYPRSYIGYNNYRGTDADIYTHDDFNHYDNYIGYRDLDVLYPGRGYVDVLRNPAASIEPLEVPDQVYRFGEEYHVYGVIPGDGIYRKHYYHDHPWDLGMDYDIGYGWFQPIVSYINKPVFKKACFSQSICQYNKCTCN